MDSFLKKSKITLAILILAVVTVGAYLYKQSEASNDLRLAEKCASQAADFYKQGNYGNESGFSSSYTNHWNRKLSKCFVEITSISLKGDDFTAIDIYDAFEGKHYAMYIGHDVCDPAIVVNPKHCQLDAGNIWFDGNDSRSPADYHVGFQGIAVGPGVGDENTQKQFLEHIQPLMSE